MPHVVSFGAGNVGRGFIGDIFAGSGWRITFLDVAPAIVDSLHSEGSYIHETVSNDGVVSRTITGVDARYSNDQDAVDQLITDADFITTSVGARVLALIAPALALGLAARWQAGKGPIDILLCENLHGAAGIVRDLLLEHLPKNFHADIDVRLGLAETSIGRMIPATLPLNGQPATLIRVEPYRQLPYDATALRAAEPQVHGLHPVRDIPFDFYTDRKLFIHNMGHCTCAYLGEILGYEYIWQAIADPRIRSIVKAAMGQSALALAARYSADRTAVELHIDDLLARFGNRELGDTTERVGRDPIRKLAADDRLLGAYRLAQSEGTPLEYLSLAAALGTRKLASEDGWGLDRATAYVEEILFGGIGNQAPTAEGKVEASSMNYAEAARTLYHDQVSALAKGLDWDRQMELIDASPLRGDII
ncbi:mannitol-1-phosphate 5-dehydrogenase [Schaalia vaccimaxillae]|uniref:mannitol dehydrogenase family protein n=1 Tax=Schaalia vaccimaxillae TaxID=183916 RepID=UPI0003B30AA4|nr:mannitol-1-phosphate 5-dehydrogenase [Schaalia vaccimaxillae]